MRPYRAILPALAMLFAGSGVAAQEIELGGQIRPRYEHRDPIAGPLGDGDSFVSMRTRLHLTASLEDNVSAFVQLQDVRLWGEETNTLFDFSADNLDLHQGYVDLKSAEEGKFLARVGRQEVNLAEQRLIGAVGWTQQSRSLDGVRLASEGDVGRIDALAVQLQNERAPEIDRDAALLAAYGTLKAGEDQDVDLYWIFNHLADDEDDPADTETSQHTLGVRWAGEADDFVYRAEGSYQTGQRSGSDVSAFMIGARLGVRLAGGRGSLTLWYDYLSGDGDLADDETKVFDTLFATNHAFYGFADLFTDLPVHTGGRGLQDMAVKGMWKLAEDWRVNVDVHSFRMADKGDLDSGHFGEEIDIVATWTYSANVDLQGGFSYVFQDDAWSEIGRLSEDMTWMYVMLDVKF